MSPRLDRRTTENRDPHTVYLTVETWDALEHAYLQQRMADASRASKIEFIEDLIRRGLPGRGRVRALASPSPAANTEPAPSPAAASSPTPAEPAARRRRRSPTEPAPRPRRKSALERLIQASDPGRPAPIESAAGLEVPEGSQPE